MFIVVNSPKLSSESRRGSTDRPKAKVKHMTVLQPSPKVELCKRGKVKGVERMKSSQS